jgi:hypothetical protein
LANAKARTSDFWVTGCVCFEDAALFGEMLSLANDGLRYPALALTPQQRRQKTMEALTAQVEALLEELTS